MIDCVFRTTGCMLAGNGVRPQERHRGRSAWRRSRKGSLRLAWMVCAFRVARCSHSVALTRHRFVLVTSSHGIWPRLPEGNGVGGRLGGGDRGDRMQSRSRTFTHVSSICSWWGYPVSYASHSSSYVFHPVILDSCLHFALYPTIAQPASQDSLFLPRRLKRFTYHKSPPTEGPIYSHFKLVDWAPGLFSPPERCCVR